MSINYSYKDIVRNNYDKLRSSPTLIAVEGQAAIDALEVVKHIASPLKEEVFVAELFRGIARNCLECGGELVLDNAA